MCEYGVYRCMVSVCVYIDVCTDMCIWVCGVCLCVSVWFMCVSICVCVCVFGVRGVGWGFDLCILTGHVQD